MKKGEKSNFFPGCFFFLLLFLLHLSGIYLFSRGFFLTRYEIPTLSGCEDVNNAFPEYRKNFGADVSSLLAETLGGTRRMLVFSFHKKGHHTPN
jgi:hypothetical protein